MIDHHAEPNATRAMKQGWQPPSAARRRRNRQTPSVKSGTPTEESPHVKDDWQDCEEPE
jgi:hypothetical protein